MRKITIIILLLSTLTLAVSKVGLATPLLKTGEQAYIIQADDWLSKLADKFYGDPLAWPAIWLATNAKAAEDDGFSIIKVIPRK